LTVGADLLLALRTGRGITCVVMGDALVDEVSPDFGVVDFTETDMDAADSSDAPGEGPACTMEHGQCP